MSTIICRRLSFGYVGSATDVFTDLDLIVDTRWRSALVGRNGRGKTTLAAFAALESDYRQLGGYEIDARVESELGDLGIHERLQARPFVDLSGGEQTRCLLAGLFALDSGFALIDEPTNHLDLGGRELLADYLSNKPGFLLVSHDRAFLDACADHVIALNPDTSETHRLSFSDWRSHYLQRLDEQALTNKALKKEFRRLETTAGERRRGSLKREADKGAHVDKGYIGARAARQMKRAIAAERRANEAVQSRKATMIDVEKSYPLKLSIGHGRATHSLLKASNLVVFRDKPLFEPVSFDVSASSRLAVLGANGSGKTSLLDLISRAPMEPPVGPPIEPPIEYGGVFVRSNLVEISRVNQQPLWTTGDLQQRLAVNHLDETRFRQIMAALGVRGSLLERPIETLSQGQQKKIELARSMMTTANLLVWDEPLNYIDIDSRERIEEVLLDQAPAMIFVEHDATFVERVATEMIELKMQENSGFE